MHSKKIVAAMAAAALLTTTAANAAEVSTENGYDGFFTVNNGIGEYKLSGQAQDAFMDFMAKEFDYDTIIDEPFDVINENSSFTVGDCAEISVNQIYDAVSFHLMDIKKDADGNISYELICKDFYRCSPFGSFKPIWAPEWTQAGYGYGEKDFNNCEVSRLVEAISNWNKYCPEDMPNAYDDVDMVFVNFYFDDNIHTVEEMKAIFEGTESKPALNNPMYYSAWCLTEQGKAILEGAGSSSADDSKNTEEPAPEYSVDVTEALSADDFAAVVAENASSDVVFKAENGVSIKFAKGTMAEVDGVEAYDFTSVISTDLDSSASDKLTKDNFVLSIDYAYSGKLPAKAEISIPVGADYAGKTLYYSRILENGVKLIDSAVVDKNGYITVSQDSCSDYILTTENIDPTASDKKASPDTGIEFNAIAAVAVAAVAALALSRKRKTN